MLLLMDVLDVEFEEIEQLGYCLDIRDRCGKPPIIIEFRIGMLSVW
jgi:hypothetical protein